MFALVLITFMIPGTANTLIGQFDSIQSCQAAASQSVLINRENRLNGVAFICVKSS
ncbi:hypothetical protein [Bosea sp. 685]|uniref:hypothetical protein n=1 Tax=Bosea sp. 685 TaxID=3080057 RepID=UPI002893467E|nr:hypothetical protein [Bosea sp. 685]WNJ93036.1 hypothetical protein RMR04_12400 [Bosea sp. 685]